MGQLLVFGQGFSKAPFQLVGEVVVEVETVAVVAGDGFLDLDDRQVGQIAEAFLTGAAQVVGIALAVAPGDFGVDEAAGPALLKAALAEQQAFQVVGEDAVALTTGGAGLQYLLYLIEEQLADDGVVSSRDEIAVHADPAGVVRVRQHGVQLAVGDWLLTRPASSGSGGEAEVGHGRGQPFDRVVTGGVQLEGLEHQGCAPRIQTDGVEQPTIPFGAYVQVAEFGASHSAAVECLITHLGLDVFAVAADFHLVDHVDHGFHGVGHIALAEVFFSRDQLDAQLGQLSFGEGRIGEVAEGPRTHVDDRVVDLWVFAQVGQHFTEYPPLLDGLGRGTRLDEHLVHDRVERIGTALAEFALGGNGVAVRVDVDRRIHLPRRRDAQVEDGVFQLA